MAKDPEPKATPVAKETARRERLLVLSLSALGVVYGDIGTSPIYAVRECFLGEFGIGVTPANVFGVLSLIFWALTIVVTVKYLGLVLRADNNGEGGAIALTALLLRGRSRTRGRALLVALGIFAAALLYGDGMITPAISVLSAIEGLGEITPAFDSYVVPLTVAILAGLFLLQRHGTGRVGLLFGPVTLLWFLVLAVLGIRGLWHHPGVLEAVNPAYAAAFLQENHMRGFLVLGAVFLVVTGTEALYADMGHFGRKPIRTAWFAVVFPALLLNYFGQGALLLEHPEDVAHPFYSLAPGWALIPLVLLATAATIIASQAVISGAFSMTRQAIQLGYCPRMQILHTSSEEIGQVYLPAVNWMLMVATIGLVVGFGSSGKLAAAYGVAVTTTMLVTTLLFYNVVRERWRWNPFLAALPVGLFLVVDLAFFGANVSKILHGAWFPLVIGGVAFVLLSTWKKGRDLLHDKLTEKSLDFEDFIVNVTMAPIQRTPGKVVFMTGDPGTVPAALQQNLKHNKVLHEEIALLTIVTEDVPRVPRDEKVEVDDIGNGFHRVVAHYGFQEQPNVPHLLALAREKGLAFELEDTSFFLSRERIRVGKRPGMSPWRERLYSLLQRNSQGATRFFAIPPDRVIEIGTQVEI